MTIRIKGDKELMRKLRKYRDESPKACGAALYQEAESIMAESIPLTPIDDSPLRNSGHVKLPEIKSGSILVRLGFGGAASAYALAVHETPSEHDPPSWKGKTVQFNTGGPKYLEKPVLAAAPGMGARLAHRIRTFLVRP